MDIGALQRECGRVQSVAPLPGVRRAQRHVRGPPYSRFQQGGGHPLAQSSDGAVRQGSGGGEHQRESHLTKVQDFFRGREAGGGRGRGELHRWRVVRDADAITSASQGLFSATH